MNTVICLVGSFGSGCSVIAKKYITPNGFKYISLSNILRDLYDEENGSSKPTRNDLQEYGNKIRSKKGCNYLAVRAHKVIEKEGGNWVIDSVRNPAEVDYLKNEIAILYVFGIFADADTRWERVKSTYNEDKKTFTKDDKKDSGESFEYGQRVSDCFLKSDIVISNIDEILPDNEADILLQKKFDKYLKLITHESSFRPTEQEALMATAYANSLRSNCLKRKVGAVLVDIYGNIFSSGYNEVPKDQQPCWREYGTCYRDHIKKKFAGDLGKVLSEKSKCDRVFELVRNNFKGLDYCKSLHAEENAILNVARFGSSIALQNATLYTTTYPCTLCANKIVSVGISKVVYLEPYPMQDAKKILTKNNIEQVSFEGVLFNGYFRFEGGVS